MRQTLASAISQRSVIQFTYEGLSRIVEPHLLGVENGLLAIEAFQIGGRSRRGGLPQWRNFHVGDIRDLCVMEQTFHVRSDFNPQRSRWEQILTCV